MTQYIFSFLVFATSAAVAAPRVPLQILADDKIVGGELAREGEFPFIVSLNSGGHFCGGSLIKKNWVLTAAHCVEGGSPSRVYVGLFSQNDTGTAQSFKAAQVIIHPKYQAARQDYDFALIRLSGDSTFEPISLNDEEIEIPSTGETLDVTVAGWGLTREAGSISSSLRKVTIPLVSKDVCKASYKGRITDRMICAGVAEGGKDSCQGDSGGPLFAKDDQGITTLIGVVSWGDGCARPKKYGVYSKVNSVLPWINQLTN